MDLDGLEITPQLVGRAPLPLTVEFVRVLTVADLELLNQPSVTRATADKPLKRIGERHHALARYIAQGYKHNEAALVLGYSVGRVQMLLTDPAFKELITFYHTTLQAEVVAATRTNFERISGLASDAADLLQERIENKPNKVSTGQLIEIVKVMADRSGNGPQTSNVQLNINVGIADRMKRAREAARQAAEPKVIEGEMREASGE